MTKVQGSYASLTKGVSQQAPSDRLEGQHGEQVNMISDPVRGLVRRNGFIMEAVQTATITQNTTNQGNALQDSFSFRTFPYRDGTQDYDVLYRSRARIGAASDSHLNALVVRNKTLGQASAWVAAVRPTVDPLADLLEANGVSAITSIGSYVLLAVNGFIPNYNTTAGIDNLGWVGTAAAWVRGGSYGRTYTVNVKRRSDNAIFSVTYTTPLASYGGVLDLTQVPSASVGTPYEQFFVNKLQADYDTKVNQWIASSSAAIVPSAIAGELMARLTSAGMGGWSLRGSHMLHDDVAWIEVTDGADGDFFRAVLTDVQDVDQLTDIHRVGKVVRVQPSNADDPYYLKAYAKTAGNTDAFQTVTWREDAGVIQSPANVMAMGRVVNGAFYWAGSPALLQALILAQTGVALTVPTWAASTAGDLTSVPPPHFFTVPITALGSFQNRLVIGSGSVLNFSRIGDYFNFYRTTVLTIPSDDPTEISAQGTDSDTIRQLMQYDKALMILGDKFHYSINGRTAFDAAAPQMSVQFTLAGSAYAQPLGIGKYAYVLKEDSQLAASRLLQVQAGAYQDSPELNDMGKQLRDYVNGTPAEMVALTSPSMVFVRTEHFLKSKGGFPRARPWGLYVFQYTDGDQGNRVQESWSAWEWSTALGTQIGMSDSGTGDAIFIYTVSFGTNQAGAAARSINVLKASSRTDPTGLPYLDGLQPAATAAATGLLTNKAVAAVRAVIYTAPSAVHSYGAVPMTTDADRFAGLDSPEYTIGDAPPEGIDTYRWKGVNGWLSDYVAAYPAAPTDGLWTGTAYPAFVDLTNPFVRDRETKANLSGQLILGDLEVVTTRAAGFQSSWIDYDGTRYEDGFSGVYKRITYDNHVWVGRDTEQVQVRLSAVLWYPLTINAIGWKGQWYADQHRA